MKAIPYSAIFAILVATPGFGQEVSLVGTWMQTMAQGWLALELTESLLADPTIGRVDSCATPDHPMIDHLWRDRLMLADQLTALGPQFTLAISLHAAGCA